MINKCWLLLPVLAVLFVSCDPARRIEMRNNSQDTAQVIWRVKKDSIGFNAFNLSNHRELKFTLLPNAKSPAKISFGMGLWTAAEIENLIRRLEWFEIRSAGRTMKIDSLPQLRDYLMARRKSNSRIEIVVDQ